MSFRLQKALGIELYHLDKLYFKPNWIEIGNEALTQKQEVIFKKDTWIIDGNYGQSMTRRIQEADTILFFDLPLRICLYRAIKRSFFTKGKRKDMAEGCVERLDIEFLKFLKYIVDFRKDKLPKIYKRIEKFGKAKRVIIFKNDNEVNLFLEKLKMDNLVSKQ